MGFDVFSVNAVHLDVEVSKAKSNNCLIILLLIVANETFQGDVVHLCKIDPRPEFTPSSSENVCHMKTCDACEKIELRNINASISFKMSSTNAYSHESPSMERESSTQWGIFYFRQHLNWRLRRHQLLFRENEEYQEHTSSDCSSSQKVTLGAVRVNKLLIILRAISKHCQRFNESFWTKRETTQVNQLTLNDFNYYYFDAYFKDERVNILNMEKVDTKWISRLKVALYVLVVIALTTLIGLISNSTNEVNSFGTGNRKAQVLKIVGKSKCYEHSNFEFSTSSLLTKSKIEGQPYSNSISLPSTVNNFQLFNKESFWSYVPIVKDRSSGCVIPQNIIAYPLVGTLNRYLRQVKDEGSLSNQEEMCYEVRRLNTFNNVRVKASPMRLARSGFFATGRDETRCFSCGVTHRNWQLMDKVDQVHRSLSPGCLHLNTGDPRNVPILANSSEEERVAGILEEYPIRTFSQQEQALQISTEDPRKVPISTHSGNSDDRAAGSADEHPQNISNHLSSAASANFTPDAPTLGTSIPSPSTSHLDVAKAVYPQYSDLTRRLESFLCWGHSHIQDPEALSKAGFYYAGYRDCVRCFYCGVGLRTWEKEDDPWVMHVRWRSSCDYIRAMKGEQFVVQALSGNLPDTSTSMSASTSPPPSQSTAHTKIGKNPSTHNANDDALAKIVEMGFPRTEVKRAIDDLGYVNVETLVEKLIMMSTPGTSATRMTGRGEDSGHASFGLETVSSNTSNSETNHPSDTTTTENDETRNNTTFPGQLQKTKTKNKKASEENRVLSLDEERQLEEENQSLREESTCKICMDNPSCIVFLPCGHLVTCAECAPALRKCPICRAPIRGSVRAHTVIRDREE